MGILNKITRLFSSNKDYSEKQCKEPDEFSIIQRNKDNPKIRGFVRKRRKQAATLKEIKELQNELKNDGIGVSDSTLLVLIKNEREYQNSEEFEIREKIQAMQSNNCYKYIETFVKKNPEFDNISANEFGGLKDLLNAKGIEITSNELKWILKSEIKTQEKIRFKKRILSLEPKTLDHHLDAFLDVGGDEYWMKIDELIEILREKNILTDKKELEEKLDEKIKQNRIKSLENNLATDNNEISIENLDDFEGHEFEDFTVKLFEKMGYTVQRMKLSNDQGADLLVTKFGEKTVVQAKRYSNTVGNWAVQEVTAAIKHYTAQNGIVITTSFFTKSAKELAESNNVRLIDRNELNDLIKKYF